MNSEKAKAHILENLEGAIQSRHKRLRLAVAAAVISALAGAGLIAGLIDYLLPMPSWTRACFLAAAVGLAARTGWRRRKLLQSMAPESIAARLEVSFPAMEDRMVTAAEVALGEIRAPKFAGDVLLTGGARLFESLPFRGALTPEIPIRAVIQWFIPLGLVVLVGMISPEGLAKHAGRLFLPGARIAPLTNTRLFLIPGDIRVSRGDDVDISLETRGVVPDAAVMFVTWDDGTREDKSMTPTGNGIFKSVIAKPAGDFDYYVEAGDAVSFDYHVRVISPPELVDPKVTLTPPAYTGITPVVGPPGPISAVVGSTVDIAGRTNPKATKAEVIVRADTEEKLISSTLTRGTLTSSFQIQRTGDWGVRLTGKEGVAAKEMTRWPIQAILDRKPVVRIRQPNRDAKVTQVAEIPVVGVASDDFGLARLRLLVGWDSAPEKVFGEFVPHSPQTKETEAAFILALENLHFEPGDIISYRFEASDANDVTGPGVATSDVRFIELVPFDAYYIWGGEGEGSGVSIASVRRLIELEKNVVRKTVSEALLPLQAGQLVSDDAYDKVRESQKRVRIETDSTLSQIDELLAQDGIGGAEKIQEALTDASRHMARAEKFLAAHTAEPAMGFEREALTALNKAIQAILFELRRARGQNQPRYQPSGPVADLPDLPKGKDMPQSGGERPKAGEDAKIEEARQAAEMAENAAKDAQDRAAAAAASDRIGPAGAQRLRDLIGRAPNLNAAERRELAELAERAGLTQNKESVQRAMDQLAKSEVGAQACEACRNGGAAKGAAAMQGSGVAKEDADEAARVLAAKGALDRKGQMSEGQRDEIETLAGQVDRMANDETLRPGQPALRAADRIIRDVIDSNGRKTYAPSGPIAQMLGEVARLLVEARDALIDAQRRRDIPAEESQRENVPEEYKDLVRDYFKRLGS